MVRARQGPSTTIEDVGALQPIHLIVILAIVLIVFGAGKLPETFRDIGRGVRNLREEAQGPTSATSSAAPSAGNVFCTSCGTAAAASAKFCASCGKAL